MIRKQVVVNVSFHAKKSYAFTTSFCRHLSLSQAFPGACSGYETETQLRYARRVLVPTWLSAEPKHEFSVYPSPSLHEPQR